MGYIPLFWRTAVARRPWSVFVDKIPVDKIAEEWRAQSSRGRYESAMWREAGLEEPGANLNAGAATAVAEAEVDNLEAGGFFACFGGCLLYTSPSPRDRQKSRMPSSA